jgi:hypothetical protein
MFDQDSPLREALEKAAFALILIFLHKLRPELEEWYKKGSGVSCCDKIGGTVNTFVEG